MSLFVRREVWQGDVYHNKKTMHFLKTALNDGNKTDDQFQSVKAVSSHTRKHEHSLVYLQIISEWVWFFANKKNAYGKFSRIKLHIVNGWRISVSFLLQHNFKWRRGQTVCLYLRKDKHLKKKWSRSEGLSIFPYVWLLLFLKHEKRGICCISHVISGDPHTA